jgi:hypothetical protein
VGTPLKCVGFGIPGGGPAVLARTPLFALACPIGVALAIRAFVQNARAAACAPFPTVWMTASVAGPLLDSVWVAARAVPPVTAAASAIAMTTALSLLSRHRGIVHICEPHRSIWK